MIIKMGTPPHVKKTSTSKMSRMKRRLRIRCPLLPLTVLLVIFLSLAVPIYKLYGKIYGGGFGRDFASDVRIAYDDDPDLMPLYRDVYDQEPWPEVEWNHSVPSMAHHHTVHYLWCGEKTFRFQHYLGVLSILRVIQPLQIVFHHTHLPVLDPFWYHTWFLELKQSVANLQLRELLSGHPCGSLGMLRDALRFISETGGIFVGEGILLSNNVDHLKFLSFWFAFAEPKTDPTRGVVFVNTGFNENTLEDYVHTILVNKPACVFTEEYNDLVESGENSALCVSLTEDLYPRDVRSSDSPFAELARWLYYGRRRPFTTRNSGTADSVPRFGHYIWGPVRDEDPPLTFTFVHFLSVLSALHVAELDHVYIHGHAEPQGAWWTELRTERVTFLRLDPPATVFGQNVENTVHQRDVLRFTILYQYGGVYQDLDTLWVNHLPTWILGYPAVAGHEWPRYYGQWPDGLDLGLFLAKRRAPFLRHFLSTYRYFRDEGWGFSSVLMPYRVYEWFPGTLFVDQFLQAVCLHGTCYPSWQDVDANNNDNDIIDDQNLIRTDDNDNNNNNEIIDNNIPKPSRALSLFNLQEVRAIRLRDPQIPETLTGPGTLKMGADIYAEVGRLIVSRAGREDLLDRDL